tara:strand:- start:1521 stop:2342 length:822 start_codon:yes stop_codon:yes gene_type:complete
MKKIIWPNKDTKFFFSMAINPGNTGAKLHNSLFRILKLNNIYIPLKVKNKTNAKNILKNLNFSGCSLSMPFKESLVSTVDKLDKSASDIKSINTILKKNNKLFGYNTDYYAAIEILKKAKLSKSKKVLLLGFGGVAKAILKALKDLKFKDITISARKKRNFNKLKICKNVKFCKWKYKDKLKAHFLINATPLGMFGKNEKKCPVEESFLKDIYSVYDLTINPNINKLQKLCEKHKIKYYSGTYSSYLQGIRQFEIYNNIRLSKKILNKIGLKF